jgi:hypothetical protein
MQADSYLIEIYFDLTNVVSLQAKEEK